MGESLRVVSPEMFLPAVSQTHTCLGEGGFGAVFLGLWRGEKVAIKRLHPHNMGLDKRTGKPPQVFQRFIAEHDTLRPISHPSIVRVFGWTGPDTERGSPGLVMEYLPTTLRERYDMEPSLNFSQHVVVMKSVASGLEYLHSRGVIHRDLTTSNIMMTTDMGSEEDGHCKITDVGVAKCLADSSEDKQMMTPTPGVEKYMAPETRDDTRAGYAKYGGKADCYTLGVAVMAMINKREPPNVFVLARHGREEDIKDIPRDHPLRPFVMQCIADKPDERPSATDLCSKLADVKHVLTPDGVEELVDMYEEELAYHLPISDSGFQEEDRNDFSYPGSPDYDEDYEPTEQELADMYEECCTPPSDFGVEEGDRNDFSYPGSPSYDEDYEPTEQDIADMYEECRTPPSDFGFEEEDNNDFSYPGSPDYDEDYEPTEQDHDFEFYWSDSAGGSDHEDYF